MCPIKYHIKLSFLKKKFAIVLNGVPNKCQLRPCEHDLYDTTDNQRDRPEMKVVCGSNKWSVQPVTRRLAGPLVMADTDTLASWRHSPTIHALAGLTGNTINIRHLFNHDEL